jgi:hypothetical protein
MDSERLLKWSAGTAVVTSVLLLSLAGLFLYQHTVGGGGVINAWNSPAVITEIKQLNELVTARGGIHSADGGGRGSGGD